MNRASAHLRTTLLLAITFFVLLDVATCWGRKGPLGLFKCMEPGDTSPDSAWHCFEDGNPDGDDYCCPGYKCNCKGGGSFSFTASGYECDCEENPDLGKEK